MKTILTALMWLAIPAGFAGESQASIIGDSYDYNVAFDFGTVLDSGSATAVDPGVDATFSYAGVPFTIDFQAGDLLELSFQFVGTAPSLGASLEWNLTDLDWLPAAGEITGITRAGGNGGADVSLAWTPDSLTIATPDETRPPDSYNYVYQLEVTHAVPEPASLIVWGVLGAVSLKRRRH